MSDADSPILVALLVVVLVGALVFVAGSAITGSFAGCEYEITHTEEECSNVEVPYESYETVYIREAYAEAEPLRYRNTGNTYYNHIWTSRTDVSTIVENTDTEGGYFKVNFDVTTTTGNYISPSSHEYIAPGKRHTFSKTFSGDYRFADNEIIAPTKTVTRYKNVPKKIPTTKYKTDYQCKDVTQYSYARSWPACFE